MTTEDLERLADEYASAIDRGGTAIHIGLMRGFKEGYRNGQLNPQIKKLEWEKYRDVRSNGRIWITVDGETAKTNIGSYELFEQDGKFLLYTIVGCLFEFETKEEAKDFAQKDFEQMVIGCIETNDNSKNH